MSRIRKPQASSRFKRAKITTKYSVNVRGWLNLVTSFYCDTYDSFPVMVSL